MFLLVFLSSVMCCVLSQRIQTVTVYPEFHSQNGRLTFDPDRWNGHHGLDADKFFDDVKAMGSRASRWAKPDQSLFPKVPEDPHRKGYADPAYFRHKANQESLASNFLKNIKAYGETRPFMMYTLGKATWPKYMGTSKYAGQFPDNLDAGVDIIASMMEAIHNFTGGHLPKYYEPVNEPGGLYRYMNFDVVVDLFKRVADRLKPRWRNLSVGGPAWTGVIGKLHENDWKGWKQLSHFLDMSLSHLDFFSYHSFNTYQIVNSSFHRWGLMDEAKTVGIIDIVENYAQIRKGKTVPIMVTEWGVNSAGDWPQHQHSDFSEWTTGYEHNAQLFTMLGSRGFMDRGDSFVLSQVVSHDSLYLRLFYANGSETGLAQAYRFWKHFGANHKFVRAESEFANSARMVTPIVLADSHQQQVFVLLHNHAQSVSKVRLEFPGNWIGSHHEASTCFLLMHNKYPVRQHDAVNMMNGVVSLPPESSCYLNFSTKYHLSGMKVVTETNHFGKNMIIPIKSNAASTYVVLTSSDLLGVQYCTLRITVTVTEPSLSTIPKSVLLNEHKLANFFSRMKPIVQSNDVFNVIEYKVPTHDVRNGHNVVTVSFGHSHGHVASVVLVVGKTSHGASIVG